MVSAPPRRRTMRAVDAVWLHMDRPENLLVIDTLLWFDDRVDPARLRALVEGRLLRRFPVFRSRPDEPLLPFGPPRWRELPEVDLDRHVEVARLPAPGGDAELRAFVEARIREPLEHDRPLWRLHLVHGYRAPDAAPGAPAGSVLLARVHHAVADGVALAHVLLSLTDPADDAPDTGTPVPDGVVDLRGTDGVVDLRDADDSDDSDAVPALLRLPAAAARAASDGLHLVSDLSRVVRRGASLDALSLAWQVGQVADKILLGTLPRSALTGTPCPDKHAVWTGSYDVAAVKATGRAAGCTVNDVLLAAVGGALATYQRVHGGHPLDLTAMVPVDVRGPGAALPPELGNTFALVLFPLVSDDRDPASRLAETHRRMQRIKASPEAALTFGVLGAVGLTHPDVERLIVDFFSAKAIGVLTNVIGPARPRTLAGVRLTSVLGWVPQAGAQTLGVCVFSYAGAVRVGFRADAQVVVDPQLLVAGFDAALTELLADAAP
jgi:diacylglycerol O-acyltransferase / wax synthase